MVELVELLEPPYIELQALQAIEPTLLHVLASHTAEHSDALCEDPMCETAASQETQELHSIEVWPHVEHTCVDEDEAAVDELPAQVKIKEQMSAMAVAAPEQVVTPVRAEMEVVRPWHMPVGKLMSAWSGIMLAHMESLDGGIIWMASTVVWHCAAMSVKSKPPMAGEEGEEGDPPEAPPQTEAQ
jgi:hypothetical protein